MSSRRNTPVPVDFNALDTTIHGPVRLGVMTVLRAHGKSSFTELKIRLEVTDGALGIHLQKLETIGYIACEKRFVGRRPRSTYRLTRAGTRAFARYLDSLRAILAAAEGA